MKLDKICRACLGEKAAMKPLFGACVADMFMSCTSIMVLEGDGLPNNICTQCLQIVNRAYSFKQLCQKSDSTLQQHLNSLNISTSNEEVLINQLKTTTDVLFSDNNVSVLNSSSIYTDIYDSSSDPVNLNPLPLQRELDETMQSLQTIAEQCLQQEQTQSSWKCSATVNQDTNCENLISCSQYEFTPIMQKCQFCDESFKDEWSLAEHTKTHTGLSKHGCLECGKLYSTAAGLAKHSITHATNKNDEKLFCCDICGKKYVEEKALKKHYKYQHLQNVRSSIEKKYKCNVCDKRYRQSKLLKLHLRTHTGERPLCCDICGKSFALPSSLRTHRLIHSNDKPHKCGICRRGFSQASNAAIHMRTHTGEKPYVCTICGKGWVTSINRDIHMRIHTGERPYKCMSCDSAFATGSQLKKHNMCHTGERPYQCLQCGKTFRQKDTRDTHVRYHTGERPFACSLCPKRYIAASHLRVHMTSHTGERKHECHICQKKFAESRTLKFHLNTHTGIKAFSCAVCQKRFAQSGSLSTHMRIHTKQSQMSNV